MALKCLTDISHLGEEDLLNVHERILASFIRAGEIFVTQAREQYGGSGGGKKMAREAAHALGFYADDTTNLRNSIGYFVFHDGKLLQSNMGPETEAKQILDLVDPQGYQLIGLAGMNYASYVEAKGYNVITIQAEQCILNLTNFLEIIGAKGKGFNDMIQESFEGMGGEYEEGL